MTLYDEDWTEQLCPYGNCTEMMDRDTGEMIGGFGPVDCPCQKWMDDPEPSKEW